MKKLALVLFVVLSLTGCAQKFPPNTAGNNGLIVIPIKASSDRGSKFFYYYELHSDKPNSTVITIRPSPGLDFVFSDPIPPGNYWFSSFSMIANQSPSTMTSVNKQTSPISIPVKVEAGKANLLSHIFEVSVDEVDYRSFSSHQQFRDMDDEEEQRYLEKLKALDEKHEWEVF